MSSTKLLRNIRNCEHCRSSLPLPPRPVLNYSRQSKVMVVGQAPGLAVHNSGVPWDDKSGDRLRTWLGVSADEFYDVRRFAIVPMAFCYPGRGKGGDLPPPKDCSRLWMAKILEELPDVETTLLIGQYAQNYFLGNRLKTNLTETVYHWRDYAPRFLVLPHSSPRNNIWLKKNEWFETTVVPQLKKIIAKLRFGR